MAGSTNTDYLQKKILEMILLQQSFTPATTLYVGLFTAAPGLSAAAAGTEVVQNAATAYARVAIPCTTADWDGPIGVDMQYKNKKDLVFPVPGTQSWGSIVAGGIFDAATGGNLLWVTNIATTKTITAGDGAPKIAAGELVIQRATC